MVYVDVVFFPMRLNTQELIAIPDQTKINPLNIISLACGANSKYFITCGLSRGVMYVWVVGHLAALFFKT